MNNNNIRRCRVCGCDDLHGCQMPDGSPCSWIGADICSACVFEVVPGHLALKQCRHCNHIKKWDFSEEKCVFRCRKGRFDIVHTTTNRKKKYLVIRTTSDVWFAWSGINQPNKTVRAAQSRCPFWEISPAMKKQILARAAEDKK
jgi:hypothetical protein